MRVIRKVVFNLINEETTMFNAKKKLIAQAIAVAFALPIAAQAQSSVTIYGKLGVYGTSNRHRSWGESRKSCSACVNMAPFGNPVVPEV